MAKSCSAPDPASGQGLPRPRHVITFRDGQVIRSPDLLHGLYEGQADVGAGHTLCQDVSGLGLHGTSMSLGLLGELPLHRLIQASDKDGYTIATTFLKRYQT